MSRARIRILLAAALVLANLVFLAGPIHAEGNVVTGTLELADQAKLSPSAVAVITLTDRSKDATSGTIIGQQRIDGATGKDQFAVQFDPATVNPKHAYTIYASLIDGDTQLQSTEPVPVITGGPLDGLVVPLSAAAYQTPAQITGTIAMPEGVELSPTAVAYAAVLDSTTGRLVSRQVIPSPTTVPIPFTVAYDAALIAPEDTYVAAAGIVDGATLYQTKSTTPVAPDATFDLTVVLTTTVIPGASGAPGASGSPVASASPGASEQPSLTPPTESPAATSKPTKEPTVAPTEAPTASATQAPTASPTAAATASPSVAATETAAASASAAPSESAGPGLITVTGEASYTDPWKLTEAAVLTITVVQVDPNGPTTVVVGDKRIANPGQVPIDFSVRLDPQLLIPTSDTFLFATLLDGNEAWTNAEGIKVATNGAPVDNVEVPLVFRPDLIEGNVTGAILDLPTDISSEAWAAVALLNTSDGTVLGLQSGTIYKGSGAVPFSVPFLIANIDQGKSYVAIGNVFDADRKFQSDSVGIITNGNPYENVILHVTQTAGPTPGASTEPTAAPSATAEPSAHPVPSPTPTSSTSTGGGIDPLVLLGILALVIVGGGAILLFMRR